MPKTGADSGKESSGMQFSISRTTIKNRKQKILSGQPEVRKFDTNLTEKKQGCKSLSFDVANLFPSTLKL
jgi:hypothetical protein